MSKKIVTIVGACVSVVHHGFTLAASSQNLGLLEQTMAHTGKH